MLVHLKKHALVTAFALCATTFSVAPMLAAQDHDRDHQNNYQNNQNADDHHDYSNNSYYRLGSREGEQDRRRNKQRANHNHHYKSDEDRKAHDYGYQNTWNNGHTDDNHDHPR